MEGGKIRLWQAFNYYCAINFELRKQSSKSEVVLKSEFLSLKVGRFQDMQASLTWLCLIFIYEIATYTVKHPPVCEGANVQADRKRLIFRQLDRLVLHLLLWLMELYPSALADGIHDGKH